MKKKLIHASFYLQIYVRSCFISLHCNFGLVNVISHLPQTALSFCMCCFIIIFLLLLLGMTSIDKNKKGKPEVVRNRIKHEQSMAKMSFAYCSSSPMFLIEQIERNNKNIHYSAKNKKRILKKQALNVKRKTITSASQQDKRFNGPTFVNTSISNKYLPFSMHQ